LTEKVVPGITDGFESEPVDTSLVTMVRCLHYTLYFIIWFICSVSQSVNHSVNMLVEYNLNKILKGACYK